MIDKQPILNSVNLAINQSLASLNDELAALMQQRVNEIIKNELDNGYLANRIQRGIVDFLSTVIDDSYKQLLLTRIANNTDQFVKAEFAKVLNNTQQTLDQSLTKLNSDMNTTVNNRVDQMLRTELAQGQLNSKLDIGVVKFLSYLVDENYKKILLSRITQNTDSFVATTLDRTLNETRQTIYQRATEIINDKISTVDLSATLRQAINNVLSDSKFVALWPKNSVPADVIDFVNSKISADSLNGGVAQNFASTGIADLASTTQVTVSNETVTLRGNLQVDGNLLLNGSINTNSVFYQHLTQTLKETAAEQVGPLVVNEVNTCLSSAINDKFINGINASVVKFNDVSIVDMGKLNQYVIESNIQKLGRLVELNVTGPANLNDTVSVRKNRIGINTTEPEATLDLWDQEVQIIVGKREANTGYIGLGRPGTLKLGVNKNNAITIMPDSVVEIPDLRIGKFEKISMAVSSAIPVTAGTPGDIIFNNDPKSNGVFAWICLEGTRWAPVRLDM
jgi:hypothetical protein